MAKLSPRAARVVAAGEAAFGQRWQSALARAAGVPQSLLAMIAGGDREPTDDAYKQVAQGLMEEADRVRATAKEIEKLARRMLRELE
ncbi:hypothetical protein H8A95_09160 [Bradyrhizobium sp. Pear76]|uniref:helix-turn-helix domain-containing protein n=1 Tax=Bradyrhizobium oropedii TaxID=1571201 RepID=UPI001E3102B3|nr:hypothetical protein [Bradyrhizobium oropedii]MCC8962477.1 hypothetical protein [Bradyrhizobium oropedii]